MVVKREQELKKSEKFELDKAGAIVLQLILENKEWVKEMATR